MKTRTWLETCWAAKIDKQAGAEYEKQITEHYYEGIKPLQANMNPLRPMLTTAWRAPHMTTKIRKALDEYTWGIPTEVLETFIKRG